MLSFKDNFFFLKFSVLFFIVTIFGYWGIDLNSEELYIAFSFFFLVILAFLMLRSALTYFFMKAVNRKYSRLLANFVRIKQILYLTERSILKSVSLSLHLWSEVEIFRAEVEAFFFKAAVVVEQYYISKNRELISFAALSILVFTRNSFRLRKFGSFSNKLTQLFSISIK